MGERGREESDSKMERRREGGTGKGETSVEDIMKEEWDREREGVREGKREGQSE